MNKFLLSIAAAVLLAVAVAAQDDDKCKTLWCTGGTVTVSVTRGDALYLDYLNFVNLDTKTDVQLFGNNRGSSSVTFSCAWGTQLTFSIFVQDTGATYYSGDPKLNVDKKVHFKFSLKKGVLSVGVEDINEQYGFEPANNAALKNGAKFDFNDYKASFTGNVSCSEPEDNTPPELTIVGPFVGYGQTTAVVPWSFTVKDDHDPNPYVYCSKDPSAVYKVPTKKPVQITCTATDASDNKVSKTFSVTVQKPAKKLRFV